MEMLKTALAVLVPVVTVVVQLRGLVQRAPRQLPPERDDGVALVAYATPPIEPVSARRIRTRRALGIAGVILLPLVLLGAVVAWAQGRWGWGLIGVVEVILLTPAAIQHAWQRRDLQPGQPVHSVRREVAVTGPLEAIATRVRRAIVGLGMPLYGSGLFVDDEGLMVQTGTGSWGLDDQSGHRVQVTVEPTGQAGRWHVIVESVNFVPSILQWRNNHRNVRQLVEELSA